MLSILFSPLIKHVKAKPLAYWPRSNYCGIPGALEVPSKPLLLCDCCSCLRTSIEAFAEWSFCTSAAEPITLPLAKVDNFVLFGLWESHGGALTWIKIQALSRAAVWGDVSPKRSCLQLTLCDAREHKTNGSEAGVGVSEHRLMECAVCCFIRTESRT